MHIFRPIRHFGSRTLARYCEMITMRLGLGRNSDVIEIASNDGYLLQHFLPLGIPVMGIEPAANIAEVARQKTFPLSLNSSV